MNGPIASDNKTWNYFNVSGVPSASNSMLDLVDVSGVPTTVDVAFGTGWSGAYADNLPNYLQGDRAYISSAGAATFTISGLAPGGAYNIALINGFNASGAVSTDFTIGGTTLNAVGTASAGGSFNGPLTFTAGVTHALFSNVIASDSGSITFNTARAAGSSFGVLAGLQIEEFSDTPPPPPPSGTKASVTHLGNQINFGDGWRSTSLAKTNSDFDPSGDNAWGTNGYYVGNGSNSVAQSLPAYIASVVDHSSHATLSPQTGHLAYDDPTQPIASTVTDLNTTFFSNHADDYDHFTITLAQDADFVLTVLYDNITSAMAAGYGVKAIQVDGPDTAAIAGALTPDANVDYAFFRIQGTTGDVFTVSATRNAAEGTMVAGLGFEDISPTADPEMLTTFVGGDAGEGLDLDGNIIYAFNLGGTTQTVRGVTFDAAPVGTPPAGITTTATHEFNYFSANGSKPAADYGTTAADNALETMMTTVWYDPNWTFDLAVVEGNTYKLQLIFQEAWFNYQGTTNRNFDVFVEGVGLAIDNLVLGAETNGANQPGTDLGLVYTYTFTATDNSFQVALADSLGGDTIAILTALTLELIPIPEPSTAILAGLGLMAVCLRRRRR